MGTAFLVIGFGVSFAAGFHVRDRRAKATEAEAAKRTAALNQQIQEGSQTISGMKAEAAQWREWSAHRRREDEENDIKDTKNQLRFIGQAKLRAVRPVNREAANVLYELEAWIKSNRPNWRVSFEVCMGAFIKTDDSPKAPPRNAAFSSYNSKRVDFLLIDKWGNPMLAVEYHGTGHDLSDDAADRMEVKRLALSLAGIPLLEIQADTSKADILLLVTDTLASTTVAAS